MGVLLSKQGGPRKPSPSRSEQAFLVFPGLYIIATPEAN